MSARTRSGPSASTATAALMAESMPPDKPSTTPGKAVLLHIVAQAQHHRLIDAGEAEAGLDHLALGAMPAAVGRAASG